MYIMTPVLKTSRRLLLWNIVRYTFSNKAVFPRRTYRWGSRGFLVGVIPKKESLKKLQWLQYKWSKYPVFEFCNFSCQVMKGNSRKGFGRCRLSCLLNNIHHLSIPLHKNSWDDISRTLFVNSPSLDRLTQILICIRPSMG